MNILGWFMLIWISGSLFSCMVGVCCWVYCLKGEIGCTKFSLIVNHLDFIKRTYSDPSLSKELPHSQLVVTPHNNKNTIVYIQ